MKIKIEKEAVMSTHGVPYHLHPNGGGLVAETAYVALTVYVAPLAVVFGQAHLEGYVRVIGCAKVGGTVVASEHVVFSGKSITTEGTFRGHKIIHAK